MNLSSCGSSCFLFQGRKVKEEDLDIMASSSSDVVGRVPSLAQSMEMRDEEGRVKTKLEVFDYKHYYSEFDSHSKLQ